jgi:hypothetical protein
VAQSLSGYLVLLLAGWTSGISIYLTVALLGISDRGGWIELPGALDQLSNPLIIALAIAIFVIEFVADKVPYVDSMWDSVHTFIRPAGAALLGYFAGTEMGPVIQTGLAVLTGGIALDSHALKASTRLAINTSPEPFSNIAASLSENAFVFFLFWFFIQHPIIACTLIVAILILSFFILRALWRFVLKLFRRPPKEEPRAQSA